MIALLNTCVELASNLVAESCMHESLVTCLSVIETAVNTLATLITG